MITAPAYSERFCNNRQSLAVVRNNYNGINNWPVLPTSTCSLRMSGPAARYSHGNITGEVVQAYLRAARAQKLSRDTFRWTHPIESLPKSPRRIQQETFFRDVVGNRESNLLYRDDFYGAAHRSDEDKLLSRSRHYLPAARKTGKVAFVE